MADMNPKHYSDHEIQPWDLLVSYGIAEDFARGCVIKYVTRYKEKGGKEDLLKAHWYLDKLLEMYKEVECQKLKVEWITGVTLAK